MMNHAHILKGSGEKGAALLTVLIALMIMSILILEFQYSAILERKLAYNELNQLQAYYLAKSGIRIGALRLVLFARAKKDPTLKQTFGGVDITPYLDTIWSMPLPAFPPEAGKLGKLLKADKDAAEKVLDETRVSDGQFTSSITSEAAKINLNHLIVPQAMLGQPISFQPPAQGMYMHVGIMLINLIDQFIRESDDPYEEYGNIRPEEVVLNIMDWINQGQQSFAGGNKDAYYESQTPPYKAKRNLFYTLDELKMVKGINERLFNKLRSHVTVWSRDGKININNASSTVLRTLYRDFTDDDLKRLSEEKARLGYWPSEKTFVDFITGTLGRSGFASQFQSPADYPFTVGTQSFMIESLGFLKKSKSQVQKVIKVGVALVATKKDVSKLSQADCAKDPNSFWDTRFPPGSCRNRPTNQTECLAIPGSWVDSTRTCRINLIGDIIAPPQGGAPGAPGTPGTTQAAAPDPNAIKILYWSET